MHSVPHVPFQHYIDSIFIIWVIVLVVVVDSCHEKVTLSETLTVFFAFFFDGRDWLVDNAVVLLNFHFI